RAIGAVTDVDDRGAHVELRIVRRRGQIGAHEERLRQGVGLHAVDWGSLLRAACAQCENHRSERKPFCPLHYSHDVLRDEPSCLSVEVSHRIRSGNFRIPPIKISVGPRPGDVSSVALDPPLTIEPWLGWYQPPLSRAAEATRARSDLWKNEMRGWAR